MKIAVTFLLMSMMVFVSHQQKFPIQPFANLLPSWPFRQQPTLQDVYEYLYARSLLQSMNHASFPHISSGSRINHPGFVPETNAKQWQDAQSRNSPLIPEIEGSVAAIEDASANPRIFLNYVTTAGGSSSYFNPFLKTVYYITSLTATSTVVKTCIPAASFTSSSSTVTCRKRREVMSVLLGENDPEYLKETSIDASQVLPMEASIAPRSLPFGDDAIVIHLDLDSSKSDEYAVEAGIFKEMETAREKRFLLAASTTITTYSFTTTTSTKTLTNIGSSLSCLPSLFALC